MAIGPVTTPMSEHCSYCPPAKIDIGDHCAYAHAPQINALDSAAHHVAMLLNTPVLLPTPFSLHDLRQTQIPFAIVDFFPSPSRPLHLTHCVQLK
jgi:hypothetical protein